MSSWRLIVVNPSMTRRRDLPVIVEEPVRQRAKGGAQSSSMEDRGRLLWAELHRRALAVEGVDDGVWLTKFATRLPCGACRAHWNEMLDRTPVTWGAYFEWTVARHNEVNTRLGKALLDVASARSLWALQPSSDTP